MRRIYCTVSSGPLADPAMVRGSLSDSEISAAGSKKGVCQSPALFGVIGRLLTARPDCHGPFDSSSARDLHINVGSFDNIRPANSTPSDPIGADGIVSGTGLEAGDPGV